ncbi:DUF3667 domain-containing protein [Psychroserpens burtonensis]|uniref:DUF3667 domain-containing protein n=1 Tax=Psychroserpens burtonensis TaxID=49278 RepID=A0A5C7BDL2_9FLAO|nr:DUF3667 domain-containing protein [Psychroserpens burtonensis]TXE17272.1 DUF3667 domain-containing protein [Psychroserpens burtonensis]
MGNQSTQCQNCQSNLKEEFGFCPNCGQKVNEELTIGVLFYNTISNYFSFDARFFKSFIPLMFRPGYLARKFLEGKRLLYLHPAQMYLFITVVFFFIFSFTVRNQAETLNKELRDTFNEKSAVVLKDSFGQRISDSMHDTKELRKDSIARVEIKKALDNNKWITGMDEKEIDSLVTLKNSDKNITTRFGFSENKIDSLIEAGATDEELYMAMGKTDDDGWFMKKLYTQILKFYKARDGGNILKAFYDTVPIALFFLLPIFAFILKVLYYNKGRYAHHLVFSFYYFSFLFTVFSIIFGVNSFWDIPDWIDLLIAFSTFVYLFIALKHFYDQGWFLSFLKSSVATFTFMLVVIPIAIIIIGLLSFMIY